MSLLTQGAEYALQAVVFLAANPDEAVKTRDIAHAAALPAGYLAKVMQALVRTGIVQSRRGLGGGFRLRIAPDRLTVLQVVESVEPLRTIDRCPLGREGEECRELCALHRHLNDATIALRKSFAETTIAELLVRPPHWLPARAEA